MTSAPVPPAMTPERRKLVSRRRQQAHERQIHEVFYGRRYDIVQRIVLPRGKVFLTFMGLPARRGYLLRERQTGTLVAVGDQVLRQAHDRYLAVRLPYRPLKRKPKPTS